MRPLTPSHTQVRGGREGSRERTEGEGKGKNERIEGERKTGVVGVGGKLKWKGKERGMKKEEINGGKKDG